MVGGSVKFEVFRTRHKQWRWRLRAKNGKLIATAGESFRRKCDCLASVGLVRGTDASVPVVML